jgi:hypothetical protein
LPLLTWSTPHSYLLFGLLARNMDQRADVVDWSCALISATVVQPSEPFSAFQNGVATTGASYQFTVLIDRRPIGED